MKIIESIRIKYFRSILNTTRGNQTHFKTNDLNVIVGSNDAGKSNYLRALSLFFNNYSEPNVPFSFWKDFSIQRHGVRREENRIEIELIINPPQKQYFKHYGQVKWTKIWKENSNIPEETIVYVDGKHKFTSNKRSSYFKWLKKIRFRYVPAIKSEKYFNDLMYSLYDVLQKDTVNLENEFNNQVKSKTNLISREITSRLNIDSILQFKGNFRDLFLNLEFGSSDGKSMLSQRGDGIKIRHIPIILQNIAEAELKEEKNREPIASTIWGFEEPENNLEYDSARKLAESFIEYIDRIHFQEEELSFNDEGIQIFLTTHSPVFYTLSNLNNPKITSFLVKKQPDLSSDIKLITNDETISIETEMKLMPLIELSRHWKNLSLQFEDLQKSKQALEKQLETIGNNKKCIVLTEDKEKGFIEKLLISNGFQMNDVDLRTYKGCTNITSAEVLIQYLKDKFKKECPIILVHKDKDYLTKEEVESEIDKYKKKGIILFYTKGTDVESYFINAEHISFCHEEIDKSELSKLIRTALDDKKQKSIEHLRLKEFGQKHQQKSSHLNEYFETEYIKNEQTLFHGKEVLKKFRGLFRDKYKKNTSIESPSEYLKDENLSKIALGIWENN
ncbi:ATP-dependent nuclease [Negadavirga shengliensis]|uniref:ATP-dependent endonuclease n=1 Tax=Negadavirga shengliensis TaxID=1389218 RepID=A0ABV9T9L0_9BACT